MTETERTIRRHVRREHGEVVDGIEDCAEAVVRSLDGTRSDDGAAIRSALRRELDRSGLLGRLPTVLAASVAAAGFVPLAEPVPAPPYVAVTSRGPVLRATTEGGRVVIRVIVFEVDRLDGASYRRLDDAVLRADVY